MSYILDALKKAEAERHLGGVQSIHAAAAGTATELDAPSFWRKHLPWLITGLLVLIMLAYVLWSHPWGRAEPAQAAAVTAPMPIAPPSVPASAEGPVSQAISQQPASQPISQPVSQPTTVTPAQQLAPLPQAPGGPAHPAPAVALEKPAHVAPPAPAVAEKAKADDSKPAAQEEEIGTMQDLPAAIQRELPQVSINGYIYARNPADRSALINKKLLHEGENVAPDLVLEKLTPKDAVLNYKGYRYRVSY